MYTKNLQNVEVTRLSNCIKSISYLEDAIKQGDFESARLEVQEILFLIEQLEKLKEQRMRKERLVALVAELQNKGINIDFVSKRYALHSLFSKNAKNAVNQ